MAKPLVVVLTGPPKIGKTTVVERLVSLLNDREIPVGGFITREIREQGVRVAFAVRDLSGLEAVIAHVDSSSLLRVGKFGVDLPAFEAVGLPAVERALAAGQVIVVDEIANMELASHAFVSLLPRVIHSGQAVVATMHLKAHSVTDKLRESGEVEIVEVTERNRDAMPTWLFDRLTQT